MCQLTYVNTGNKEINKLIIYLLSVSNSEINRHGWGLLSGSSLFRTELQAAAVSDAGICINKVATTDAPIFGHTRFASRGVVNLANVHPFDFKNVIGFHNGTLLFPGEVKETSFNTTDVSRDTDSKQFFGLLDKELAKEADFVTAINNVMKPLQGKFAFLVRDKRNGKEYAVRGKTANLHIADVVLVDKNKKNKAVYTRLGYVINTEKTAFEKIGRILSNLSQLILDKMIVIDNIRELKTETIYELGDEVIEVGKITENPLLITTIPYQSTYSTYSTSKSNLITKCETISEWMEHEFLTPRDVEIIFNETMGINLYEVSEKDLDFFIQSVMPLYELSDKVVETLERLFISSLPPSFFKDYGLQFPLSSYKNKESKVISALNSFTSKERNL